MEWHEIIVATITAVPPTIVASMAWRNSKKNTAKVDMLHATTNSRLDALIESTRALASLQGFAAGVESQKKQQSQDMT